MRTQTHTMLLFFEYVGISVLLGTSLHRDELNSISRLSALKILLKNHCQFHVVPKTSRVDQLYSSSAAVV